MELTGFIKRYKDFNREFNRLENVPMQKYRDIPKLNEEARKAWRSDPEIFKH
jgi:hypothetical protein